MSNSVTDFFGSMLMIANKSQKVKNIIKYEGKLW